ncbi:MAG TPA: hypothetical protein VHV76_04120 [Mycobacteriales bacterium]|nr:hypothetical protein [Mycobacteriales bacterium]
MTAATPGVQFAADESGQRSSSRFGRQTVAAALAAVDPVGALAAERETSWRSGYVAHFRRMVEAGLATPEDWNAIASAGLDAFHDGLVVVDADGTEQPLRSILDRPVGHALQTVEVKGEGSRDDDLALPYRGQKLRGEEIHEQLARWVADGVIEPSTASAVGTVVDHPDWLRLDGHTVAVLGAGSQMGPLPALLRWGATVAAIDVPSAELWRRLLSDARGSAGHLLTPATDGSEDPERAGTDLLVDGPAVADWLAEVPGRLVIGNYTYADGADHVRLSAAVDLVGERVRQQRDDVTLAFLATPTDAFVVPEDAVADSIDRYRRRSRVGKLAGRPLRAVSRGNLLQRAYLPGTDLGICDALVPIQGPNYALAKRLQRWRATTARAAGVDVSLNVAPSTRTRSVVKNRALAAAYAGAHRFGVEVFEPDTANTLMAALLVHDLNSPEVELSHPWQHEASNAAHGGLWRSAYAPRSALGLAAVFGYAAARN